MLVTRCRCPECDAALKLSTPVADGERMRCPDCGAPFTVGDGEAIQADPSPARRPARRAVGGDERDDRRPRRPRLADDTEDFDRPRRSEEEGGSTALIVGLVVGGVLLLFALGGVGIYFLVRNSGGSAAAQNNAGQPAQPAPGNPMGVPVNPPGASS